MRAFIYGIGVQWKLDLRNKGILITYYLVPLVFFGFMGMIFTSINPEMKDTLIQTMTIFAFSMGAFLGTPSSISEMYSGDIKKAFKVGGIPLWAGAVNHFISAFIHLLITGIIIYIIAPFAFDAKLPENPVLYFISTAVFLMVNISIGTVLGLYVKSPAKLTMFAQLLFLPSLMLSGIMFPTNMLPKAVAVVGYALPATWGLKLMTESELNILNIVILLLFFTGAVIISSYKLAKIGID
ncbi:MAG: transporter [Herbinix sp.]|jgi:ABC-2 type transport system permease protein|nr:transporter [Herbinix sp.]